MKRSVKLILLFVVIGGLLMVTGIGSSIEDKLVLYARIAELYTQKPDAKLAMPLENVLKSQIANTWHAPRGAGREHEGQDLFAPKGTPIFSATNGYVYRIGENNLGGQTVSIIGAGGRVYYYAHLDAYAPQLAEGDYVSTHTLLGYVGTTGNAQGTPPHLHFGIYTSSGAINPLPFLMNRPATTTGAKPANAQRRLVSRRVAT